MKALPAIAFVTALAAFLLLPFSFEVAGSVLFAAGFAALAWSDYAGARRPVPVRTAAAGATAARSAQEKFGLAA